MNRKAILTFLAASALGAFLALGTFVMLMPKNRVVKSTSGAPMALANNYIFDSTDFVVPEGLNFVFAAKAATPSVVHIRSTFSSTSPDNPFNDFFRDYFGENERGNQSKGMGSGVVVSEDGYIVTNNHVVEDATEIEVLLNDNRTYEAQIIGTDPSTDLAVIKIQESNLKAVAFGNSDNIQIGEWVLAIGNPFEFRSTVTAGIVSAKGRNINILSRRDRLQVESFIQTDAAVNPGNSGGALVNLKGELVGINTAIASPTGAYAGYSFAVPVSLVGKVVDDLRLYGTVQRALLGISIVDMNANLSKEKSIDLVRGVYVQSINPESAAEEAGLKNGDVILAVKDKKVNNVAQLQEQVALNRPGDRIKVTYYRNGKTQQTYATLKNTYGTTNVIETSNSFKRDGATFEEVPASLKDKLRLSGGVHVVDVSGGAWKAAGMKKGFVITRVDKSVIKSLEEFITKINSMRGEGMLVEGYYPDGEKAYYGIGW